MAKEFSVQHIDHVELFVPDCYQAAKWYRETLGLQILTEYEHWAKEEGGPLMISSDGGSTKLALFQGEARSSDKTSWYRRVAFRVDGQGFVEFLKRLESHPVFADNGKQVTSKDAVDHTKAFSIYFCDPYGHPLEVTTYDYDYVFRQLSK